MEQDEKRYCAVCGCELLEDEETVCEDCEWEAFNPEDNREVAY